MKTLGYDQLIFLALPTNSFSSIFTLPSFYIKKLTESTSFLLLLWISCKSLFLPSFGTQKQVHILWIKGYNLSFKNHASLCILLLFFSLESNSFIVYASLAFTISLTFSSPKLWWNLYYYYYYYYYCFQENNDMLLDILMFLALTDVYMSLAYPLT